LTLGSVWPGEPATDAHWVTWWEDEVTARTDGLVTFENHWGGSLISAGQMQDAVQQRITDVVQWFYGYAPSTLPLGNYQFAIPFRPSSPATITKIHRMLWAEIPEFEAELNAINGKTILFGPAANYDVLGVVPMCNLNYFVGKKIACVGLWFPEQVEGSGGVALSNPAGERYVMFERGTIDAEVLVLNQIDSWKHYEVAKYLTRVDIGALNAMSIVMNLDAWNELPADIQQIIMETAADTEAEYAAWLDDYSSEVLVKWQEEDGVEICTMSDADRTKWAEQMVDTAQMWADQMEEKGLPGKQIINRFIELSEQEGHVFPIDLTVE